jgi:hypothetical protein
MEGASWCREVADNHYAAAIAGCAILSVAALSQSHFKADSIPDLFCGLILLRGKLLATVFPDRGTASPQFLWRSQVFTAILFSAFAYVILRRRRISG